VVNDAGLTFKLVSGTIGGYDLDEISRRSATSYRTFFTVAAGGNSYEANENIPVSDLVISYDMIESEPYEDPIVQAHDLLDAEYPVVESMSVVPGNYRINDEVIVNIRTDGTGYDLGPASTINGIPVTEPNVIFTEIGSNNYSLSYIVEEGDHDADPGELNVTVIMIKPSGNTGSPYSTLTNASDITIDANPPRATRMEVPSEEVGVGGTVQVTITADGTGYQASDGTVINGIPLNFSRVSFSEAGNRLYELSYVVDINDNPVAPGHLQVSLVMLDLAGNISLPFTTLQSNALEIYTDLPTAVLAGTPEICAGEQVEMTVYLSGRGPWSFNLYNGTTTTTYTNISSSEYELTVSPDETTTYRITSVRDVNGVTSTGSGDLQVIVHDKTYVEIINLAKGYSVDADPVRLEANVSGGSFSGPGVIMIGSVPYFDPALADTVNSPHRIYYTYVNNYGCVSVASALVFVLGAEGDIFIPSKLVCDDSGPFEVNAYNVAEATGSFRLLDANDNPVPGLIDHWDNSATVDPSLLSAGSYTIEYEYFDQVFLHLRETFAVESVPVPVIISPAQYTFCQSSAPVLLQADVPGAGFSGTGVIGNATDGFMFDPGAAELGNNTITCSVVTVNGCSKSSQKDILVQFAPEVRFTMSTGCISQEGGNIAFNNLTGEKLKVESWDWNFDDPASGQNNHSNLIDPEHFYQETGERNISLTATTYEGCVATSVLDTAISHNPVADFTWISDCYFEDSGTEFINRTIPGSTVADTLVWTFRNINGDILDEIGTHPLTDTVKYQFNKDGNYRVDLFAMNEGGCSDSISKKIMVRPTIKLMDSEYDERFDESGGMWTVHSEDQTESWVWDIPDFSGFDRVEGDMAWFTQLPLGTAGYLERSWLQSPCFDFEGFKKPLFKLDIMRSFVPNYYGTVLQYQDNRDEGWKTVGESNTGIEWYTGNNIVYQPGGSNVGWGLNVFDPDTAWVTAIHDIYDLAGLPGVTFRIAIVTNSEQGIGNQGFAFDNVTITERSKHSVLEYFTNASDMTSRLADDLVDSVVSEYPEFLTDVQYHMDYPGEDPMNQNNPHPSSTRSFYYGIPELPFAILNGGDTEDHRYNFSELKTAPDADHIRLLSLEIPLFGVDMSVDWTENSLEATTLVTCNADRYNENIQLYIVVFESEVTAYTGNNGDTIFRNVVLDMLPTPAGKLLGGDWESGEQDTLVNTWMYADYVEDIKDLGVTAFIQDRATGRILQAAVDYYDTSTGTKVIRPVRLEALHVYPNPAKNSFFVNLGTTTDHAGRFDLLDMNGRVVMTEKVPPGYQVYQIDIQHLNRGIYILHWYESGRHVGFQKIVKTE
jgi:hypothetical protein